MKPPDELADLLSTVRQMVELVEQSDASEVELEAGGMRIRLQRAARLATMVEASPAGLQPMRVEIEGHQVRAPITGIWYDAASSGAPPYVQVGSLVEVGTTIGLIETMKIFNEITADVAGAVTYIHVHRGDLVNIHSPLITVQADESAAIWPHRE